MFKLRTGETVAVLHKQFTPSRLIEYELKVVDSGHSRIPKGTIYSLTESEVCLNLLHWVK